MSGLGLCIVHNSLSTHFDIARNSSSLIDYCLMSYSLKLLFSSLGQCSDI